MKKQGTSYVLIKYQFPKKIAIRARREVPYEFRLVARLVLDELIFNQNKQTLERQINEAIDQNDTKRFYELSKQYSKYL